MLRYSGSICLSLDDKILFFNLIFPDLIFSSPAIVRNIVVLPIPEGPRRQIISPSFSIDRFTLLTLFFPPAVKDTFSISK